MLFDVEVDSGFLFRDKQILSRIEFKKFAESNNVDINNIVLNDEEYSWRLFEIMLRKYDNQIFIQTLFQVVNFEEYINLFKIISDMKIKSIDIESIDFNFDEYKFFFKFLILIHYIFKKNEHYKLMWNLESYIKTTCEVCIEKGASLYELNELTKQGNINYLFNIYQGNEKEYFISQSKYFIKKDINRYFEINDNTSKDFYVDFLFSNEKYFDTLHTIIEINKQYIKYKYNKHLLTSLIRGIVLNLEELIKITIVNNPDIFQYTKKKIENIDCIDSCEDSKKIKKLVKDYNDKYNIEKLDLYEYLKLLSDRKIEVLKNKLGSKYKLNIYKRLRFLKQHDCEEKYLLSFHFTRNYIAHNQIDFSLLFRNNGTAISMILDSVIFILIYLEYKSQKKIDELRFG